MGEETITVGRTRTNGDVQLPVIDLLTGRGFVTGKSGSGKSNSASVIAEKLLDRGYSLLAVDIDGEYYGLKEEYEILHVGADEECDLRVGVEHAEKIAELALAQSVPIILDVSSFLDESEARELLTEVTKQLFAKGKKVKQPFMMLVEEVHEYIPEGGGIDECGRMLIKISKRGRKHGLGIVGISQRPADVKKDFITQCDWLVWHRLTWNNDTKVVSRILGSEFAEEIEEMDDGEGFLMTDWNEAIRRVQFERKQTFDAGATPGLDDFERPELKSVSGDLVAELESISDEQERRENRITELERELQQREERIRDLEQQLADARDLKQMADRFSRAMMDQVTGRPLSAESVQRSGQDGAVGRSIIRDPELTAELDSVRNGEKAPMSSPVPDAETEHGNDDGTGSEHETGDTSTVGSRSPEETARETDEQGSEDGLDGQIPDLSTISQSTEASGGRRGTVSETAPAVDTADLPLVSRLHEEIQGLDEAAIGMLRQYFEYGPMEPQDAHESAGNSGDRGPAYATNRNLRQRGLIAHVGCGLYDYALAELVREELTDPLNPEAYPNGNEIESVLSTIESVFIDDETGSTSGPETTETAYDEVVEGADPLPDLQF